MVQEMCVCVCVCIATFIDAEISVGDDNYCRLGGGGCVALLPFFLWGVVEKDRTSL